LLYVEVYEAAEVEAVLTDMRRTFRKAAYELNAIRARDGAPQHIDWDRGRPLQTNGCDPEYFDSLVDECFAALQKCDDALSQEGRDGDKAR
jgi:hypothetical protein